MYDTKRPLFTRPVPNSTSGVPFIKLSPKYRVPRPSPPQPSPSPPVPDYYSDYEETEDLSPEIGISEESEDPVNLISPTPYTFPSTFPSFTPQFYEEKEEPEGNTLLEILPKNFIFLVRSITNQLHTCHSMKQSRVTLRQHLHISKVMLCS